ncbi:DNA helicase INO80 isoform X2 [Tanacetum coccineum]
MKANAAIMTRQHPKFVMHKPHIATEILHTSQYVQVTVYRLICKETFEENILQRASQKSTVQQLVMTGGHVEGDLLAPEDIVSLLIHDPQLEQN